MKYIILILLFPLSLHAQQKDTIQYTYPNQPGFRLRPNVVVQYGYFMNLAKPYVAFDLAKKWGFQIQFAGCVVHPVIEKESERNITEMEKKFGKGWYDRFWNQVDSIVKVMPKPKRDSIWDEILKPDK